MPICRKCGEETSEFYANRKTCKICCRKYQNSYWATHLEARLRNDQRARIRAAFVSQHLPVPNDPFSLVGCSSTQLKEHLERQFDEAMSWETHGESFEIDHVVPVSAFDLSSPREASRAFSWTNTQALTKAANRAKRNLLLFS